MARLDSSQRSSGPSGIVRLLVILICVSVILITFYYREGSSGPVHLLRSGVQTITSPFRSLGSQLSRPFDHLGNIWTNATADTQTLTELEATNEALEQQVAQLNEYAQQNERLLALLNLTSSYAMSGTSAYIVGYSTDSWTDTATINKGSIDGISLDMPVVDGTGVVGQVVEVAAGSATVRLLSDPSSGVSAQIQGGTATGILTGSVDGTLRLRYVDTAESVAIGDIVVTSGLGGVYPQGLLLGTVASCTSTASSLYYEITVTPAVTMGGSKEVFAVSSFDIPSSTGEEQVPAQEGAAQDAVIADGQDEAQLGEEATGDDQTIDDASYEDDVEPAADGDVAQGDASDEAGDLS